MRRRLELGRAVSDVYPYVEVHTTSCTGLGWLGLGWAPNQLHKRGRGGSGFGFDWCDRAQDAIVACNNVPIRGLSESKR